VKTVEQRFWEKVGPRDDPEKCWLWMACIGTKCGYGFFWLNGRMKLAHRVSYEMYHHVTIPEGMTLDHVKTRGCTNTLCVNPHHLEVVTQKVNVLRGDAPSALHAKVTHCPQGHPYNEENTYVTHSGGRDCRICHNAEVKYARSQHG
jgi:hypothetical protein